MPPEYFKRSLRPHEAEKYLDGLMMRQRAGWEQARLIVSPWRSENSKPLTFPWETEAVVEPSADEIEDVRQWAAQATEMLNKKTNGRKCDSSEITTRF